MKTKVMKGKLKHDPKIKFASESEDDGIPENAFDQRNVKERITCMIDGDVVEWLRAEAGRIGIGYQTLLNMKLRESMGAAAQEESIRKIVRDEMRKRA